MTSDRWQILCTKFRSPALRVWELWCFEYLEEKDDSISGSIRDSSQIMSATEGAEAEIMLTFRRADFNVAKISGRKKVRKLRFYDRKIPFSKNDIYFLVTSKYALLVL